jgi:hypothetical protein
VATAVNGGNSADGTITYRIADGDVYRVAASQGATPVDISTALNTLSPAAPDAWLNESPDGAWLLLATERFDPDCSNGACLALINGDLKSGGLVRAGGQLVRPEAFAAVANGGKLIVVPINGGPHSLDLWAIDRSGDTWAAPRLLTGDSPYAFNEQPATSADGNHVLFDCGNQPYAAEGTAICEIASDGTGFRVVRTPDQPPSGFNPGGALHHPDYAPDGSIVFEGNWNGERIWRLPAAGADPVLVAPEVGNDNSPCVLNDGRIASLWLDHPSGPPHELKVMGSDGQDAILFPTDLDVADIGLGCGG